MRISYRIEGEGDRTLFFIHGWASDKSVWQNPVAEFKRDFQVISVDLRGHGETPWVATDNLLDSFCEDILELCSHLRLKQINFVGWSMAGFILMELCKKYPELISSLILITSTPRFLNTSDYHCGIAEPNLRLLERKLNDNFDSALEEFRLYMFTEEEKAHPQFTRIWDRLKKIVNPNQAALFSGLRLLENTDFREDLGNINKPTLLIAGERDAIIPKSASEFLQEKIQDSQLFIFEECGHAPFLTQAEKFNQILSAWINRK